MRFNVGVQAVVFLCCFQLLTVSATAQILPGILNQKKQNDSTPVKSPPVTIQPDSSGYSIMTMLEDYTTTLNTDLALLRRGFDTTEISRELPVMEDVLAISKRNIETRVRNMNLRNLFSFQVALMQIDKQVTGHQQKLLNYAKLLSDIRTDVRGIKDIGDFSVDPEDSIVLSTYVLQMKPIQVRKALVDSMQKAAQKKIGVLQNRATAAFIQATELLDEVNNRIRTLQARFFIRDQPFIWNARPEPTEKRIFDMIGDEFARNSSVIRFYNSLNLVPIICIVLAAIAFYIFIRFNYKKLIRSNMIGRDLPLHYFKRSMLASTMLIFFTFTPYILRNPPAGIVQTMWFCMLFTATLLRWNDWNKNFRKHWTGIILFFIFYGVDNFLLESSFSERLGLLIMNVLAVLLGVVMYREVRKDRSSYHTLVDESILLFMIINLLALGMNVAGRFTLAKVLSNSSALSVGLLLALQIIKDILFEFIYLVSEANKKSRFYGFFEFDKLKESFRGVLNLATFIIWILAFAWSMNFSDIIIEKTTDFLSKQRKLGEISFTFNSILVFLFLIWLSVILGKLITMLFRTDTSSASLKMKRRGSWVLIFRLVIYTTGFLIAIGAAGIPLDKLTIVLGALSVGIGFGLQTITNNLISGIILAFERPIQVGDIIDIGTKTGTVKEIGIRSSKIAMFDGSDMIVPNGDLLSQHLINWTHDNPNKRNELLIGVAYGTDLEQATNLIKTALADHKEMMTNPAPSIFLHEFADSAVNLRVLFWAANIDDAAKLKSDVMSAIYANFAANGIEIPFPQSDIHIRSMHAAAATVLNPDKVVAKDKSTAIDANDED